MSSPKEVLPSVEAVIQAIPIPAGMIHVIERADGGFRFRGSERAVYDAGEMNSLGADRKTVTVEYMMDESRKFTFIPKL